MCRTLCTSNYINRKEFSLLMSTLCKFLEGELGHRHYSLAGPPSLSAHYYLCWFECSERPQRDDRGPGAFNWSSQTTQGLHSLLQLVLSMDWQEKGFKYETPSISHDLLPPAHFTRVALSSHFRSSRWREEREVLRQRTCSHLISGQLSTPVSHSSCSQSPHDSLHTVLSSISISHRAGDSLHGRAQVYHVRREKFWYF